MKENHLKFTKRGVDALPAPKTGKAVYWDSDLRGFGLRISPKATVSYFVQARTDAGRQIAYTIGRHGPFTADQARKKAHGETPAPEPIAERIEVLPTRQLFLPLSLLRKRS